MVNSKLWARVSHSCEEDESLAKLVKDLHKDLTCKPNYEWIQDQLRRKGRLVVENDGGLKQLLLRVFHASTWGEGGHSGIEVTMERIAGFFYLKGLKELVKNFIKECKVCQRYKGENTPLARLL